MKTTKFKPSEVGPVPVEWEVKRLGEIGETSSGGTPSRAVPAYYQGSVKWFTTSELKDCDLYDSVEHISLEALQCSSAKIYPSNTLLMAMYGATIGKLGVLRVDAASNQACCAIECKHVNVRYLYYRLLFSRSSIVEKGCGAGQPNISQEIVGKLQIPVPPRSEQEKIAEALSDVDALLAAMTTLIEKKRAIKQGAMQQLLGMRNDELGMRNEPIRRLAGFSGKWVGKRLGEVCEIIMGQSPASCYYNQQGNGLPLIQGNADLENRKSIIRFYTSQVTKICDVGDVIMSVRAPVGAVGKAMFKSCLGRGVCALKCDSDYLYQYLLSVEDKWGEYSKGSTFDSINSNELSDYELMVPPTLAEQKAIAAVLSDMDAEIAALESKRAKYESIKQGMMQELLTGRVRLVGWPDGAGLRNTGD